MLEASYMATPDERALDLSEPMPMEAVQRPYPCPYCGKAFRTRNSMYRHIHRTHNSGSLELPDDLKHRLKGKKSVNEVLAATMAWVNDLGGGSLDTETSAAFAKLLRNYDLRMKFALAIMGSWKLAQLQKRLEHSRKMDDALFGRLTDEALAGMDMDEVLKIREAIERSARWDLNFISDLVRIGAVDSKHVLNVVNVTGEKAQVRLDLPSSPEDRERLRQSLARKVEDFKKELPDGQEAVASDAG